MSKFLIEVPDQWDACVAGALCAAISNPDAVPMVQMAEHLTVLGRPDVDADGYITYPNRMRVRRQAIPAIDAPTRLYGSSSDDEVLFLEVDEVVGGYLEYYLEDDREWDLEIVEWSVRPNCEFLPSAEEVIEHVIEMHLADAEIDEHAFEDWENRSGDEGVVAAFGYALDLWASKIRYSMADRELSRRKTYKISTASHIEVFYVDDESLAAKITRETLA